MKVTSNFIQEVIDTARAAGEVILEIYKKDFNVNYKGDESPITEADLKANDLIVERLLALDPSIAIVSEELPKSELTERSTWDCYWMIDPMDGTKHFVNKDGQFSVNIALMVNHKPILGVIYAPTYDVMYWGAEGIGSFKIDQNGTETTMQSLKVDKKLVAIIGGSQKKGKTSEFLERVSENFESLEIQSMGSSLKMCLIADGLAHVYPRLGGTCEWDTAAAHIILQMAGGEIYSIETMEVLAYNQREDLLNPEFFAVGQEFPMDLLEKALDRG